MESNTDFAFAQEWLWADITNSLAFTIANGVRDEFKRPEFGENWLVSVPAYDKWIDVIAERIARELVLALEII